MGARKLHISGKPGLLHGDDHREKERGNGVHVHSERHGDQDNGGDIGEEDPAGGDGKRRQVHVVATVRENAVPLEHGHDAGNRHGKGQKEILVGQR